MFFSMAMKGMKAVLISLGLKCESRTYVPNHSTTSHLDHCVMVDISFIPNYPAESQSKKLYKGMTSDYFGTKMKIDCWVRDNRLTIDWQLIKNQLSVCPRLIFSSFFFFTRVSINVKNGFPKNPTALMIFLMLFLPMTKIYSLTA